MTIYIIHQDQIKRHALLDPLRGGRELLVLRRGDRLGAQQGKEAWFIGCLFSFPIDYMSRSYVCVLVPGMHTHIHIYKCPRPLRTCAQPGLGHHDELAGLQRQVPYLFIHELYVCECLHIILYTHQPTFLHAYIHIPHNPTQKSISSHPTVPWTAACPGCSSPPWRSGTREWPPAAPPPPPRP